MSNIWNNVLLRKEDFPNYDGKVYNSEYSLSQIITLLILQIKKTPFGIKLFLRGKAPIIMLIRELLCMVKISVN